MTCGARASAAERQSPPPLALVKEVAAISMMIRFAPQQPQALVCLHKPTSEPTHLCCRGSPPIKERPMPSSETERPDHGGAGLAVEEAEPKTKQPPLYQVVLLNDDYTPMEFVVDVLEKFFRMDRTTATRVMLRSEERRVGKEGTWGWGRERGRR